MDKEGWTGALFAVAGKMIPQVSLEDDAAKRAIQQKRIVLYKKMTEGKSE